MCWFCSNKIAGEIWGVRLNMCRSFVSKASKMGIRVLVVLSVVRYSGRKICLKPSHRNVCWACVRWHTYVIANVTATVDKPCTIIFVSKWCQIQWRSVDSRSWNVQGSLRSTYGPTNQSSLLVGHYLVLPCYYSCPLFLSHNLGPPFVDLLFHQIDDGSRF